MREGFGDPRCVGLRVKACIDLEALGRAPMRQGLNHVEWAARGKEAAGEADPKRVEGEVAGALGRHIEPQEVAQHGVNRGVRHGGEGGGGEDLPLCTAPQKKAAALGPRRFVELELIQTHMTPTKLPSLEPLVCQCCG